MNDLGGTQTSLSHISEGQSNFKLKMNQTIEQKNFESFKLGNNSIGKQSIFKDKKESMKIDPNSNYQLKSKYISQDLIPEESHEFSSKLLVVS